MVAPIGPLLSSIQVTPSARASMEVSNSCNWVCCIPSFRRERQKVLLIERVGNVWRIARSKDEISHLP